MKMIPLSRGKYALVDDEDFEWLSQWKWSCNSGYARRKTWEGIVNGKPKRELISMHRAVWERYNGPILNNLQIDHINGKRADNRLTNLRLATNGQNQINSQKYKSNKSGYKGVCWHKGHKKWQPQLQLNKKRVYLGFFDNKEDAAMAYNWAAVKYFGEYAVLNEVIYGFSFIENTELHK